MSDAPEKDMEGHLDAIPASRRQTFMEHRWGRRLRCRARARISAGVGMNGSGQMRDVSMSGAFIETAMPLPLLAQVEIAVSHRDDPGETEISGCVVRIERDGVAIEWTDPSPAAICPLLGCNSPCAAANTEST
jgi:hypothetical protein